MGGNRRWGSTAWERRRRRGGGGGRAGLGSRALEGGHVDLGHVAPVGLVPELAAVQVVLQHSAHRLRAVFGGGEHVGKAVCAQRQLQQAPLQLRSVRETRSSLAPPRLLPVLLLLWCQASMKSQGWAPQSPCKSPSTSPHLHVGLGALGQLGQELVVHALEQLDKLPLEPAPNAHARTREPQRAAPTRRCVRAGRRRQGQRPGRKSRQEQRRSGDCSLRAAHLP